MGIKEKIKLNFNMGKLTFEFFKSGIKLAKSAKKINLVEEKENTIKENIVELFEKTDAILGTNASSSEFDYQIEEESISDTSYRNTDVYTPKLDEDLLPTFQTQKKDLSKYDTLPSILDKTLVELEGMNIVLLQELLYDELYDLKDMSEEVREVQLRKIFDRLFEMQPKQFLHHYDSEFNSVESRMYIDLISAPGISKLSYVRSFLEREYESEVEYINEKRNMLLSIYKYYDTHTEDQIEKINYIFRSSSEVGRRFLTNSGTKYDFASVFPDDFIDSFSKEDLSQLYRFYFCSRTKSDQYKLKVLMSSQNRKEMFVISEMVKKVNSVIGNSAVFLEPALSLLYEKESFKNLLIDFYNTNIGSRENEKYFSSLVNEQDPFMFKQLINYVIQYGNDSSLLDGLFKKNNIHDFKEKIYEIRDNFNEVILGDDGFRKVKNNDFNIEFRSIYTERDLKKLKSAILYNLYGISLRTAEQLKKYYGEYIDEFMKGIPSRNEDISDEDFLNSLDESKMVIAKEDYSTLEVFKAILNIVDLDINDRGFDSKVYILQSAYLKQIKEKGLNHQEFMAASSIVEGLLNKMVMNTYNKRLLNANNGIDFIKVDDGVAVFDAGVNFDMIITSLQGDGALYDDFVNMASKWNTASMSTSQGLCASHISSQNLGVIDLNAPILGFSNIPSGSLYSMGPNDIFSKTSMFNLKNNYLGYSNRKFIPGSIMSNETRYGYNEILLDRFMINDAYGTIKMQPDYVVYYKFENDFARTNDEIYRRSLKVAKDFNIPIVVVDVPKIKKHEKESIKVMEEKLFSSDEVDKDLFKKIMVRYMNNYSGSLSISYFYPNRTANEFSIDGMEQFFNMTINKIKQQDSFKGVEWLKVLEECYLEERKKYDVLVNEVSTYKASVKTFVLNNYNLRSKISDMKDDFTSLGYSFEKEQDNYINPNSMPEVSIGEDKEGTFLSEKTYLPIHQVLINLANEIEIGTTFEIIDNYELTGNTGKVICVNEAENEEVLIVENLVSSYFLECCEESCMFILFTDGFNSSFNVDVNKEFDFTEEVLKSSFYSMALDTSEDSFIRLDSNIVENFVSVVEKIDDKKFLDIFKPIIEEKVKKDNSSFEALATRMLDKKNSIRENFDKLQVGIKKMNNEDTNVSSQIK